MKMGQVVQTLSLVYDMENHIISKGECPEGIEQSKKLAKYLKENNTFTVRYFWCSVECLKILWYKINMRKNLAEVVL